MNVNCDLPFPWCPQCAALQLDSSKFYSMGEVYETRHYCKNESSCIACEQARRERDADGTG